MKILKFCKKYLIMDKYRVTLYMVLALLAAAIKILSPYILGNFVDYLVKGGNKNTIFNFCIIFSGLSLVRLIRDYISSMLSVKMQTKMGYFLNINIIKHIQRLSLSFINHKNGIYLNQRVNEDSFALISFCLDILESFITNIIMLVIPFILLLRMNILITCIMIIYIVAYILIYFLLRNYLYKAGFEFRESQANFFNNLYEQLKYIKLIKFDSIQKEINDRSDISYLNYKKVAISSQRANYVYTSLDSIISTLAQITLFIVGGIQVIDGKFTVGMFTIFSSYFNMLLNSSSYFFSLGAFFQHVLSSYNRMTEILKFDEETNGDIVINSINKISINNLTFSYENYKMINKKLFNEDINLENKLLENVFSNVNYDFEKGNIYSIVGANGSGKSTIINLIIGLFVNEYTGNISYNGINLKKIDMVAARKNLIGIAEQEPLLLNDSIAYNITFNEHIDIRNDLFEKYLDILNMAKFIKENTLNFVIDEKNTNLSGGEKQKLAILKVLYKNPEVMIFDEPTSALDYETRKKFMSYLTSIKNDKIIIIITHDSYISNSSDKLLHIEKIN